MVTDSVPTNRQRIYELVQNASKMDSEVEVREVPFEKGEEIKVFGKKLYSHMIGFYMSHRMEMINELRDLNKFAKRKEKIFLPAICLEQVGLSGPLVHPESEGCWESAWRRIHQSALQSDQQPNMVSSTAGSILANVTVFEFFKKVTGIAGFKSE